MLSIALDAKAGRLPEERARRGIDAETTVRVVVQVIGANNLPMSAMAAAGGAFVWLDDEPELYTYADLARRSG